MSPAVKTWIGGAFAVVVNSLWDGAGLGVAGGGASLLRNAGTPMPHRILWAAVHVVIVLAGNALLDLKSFAKLQPFPNPFPAPGETSAPAAAAPAVAK